MDFRFPAEWEPHKGTWMAWPSNMETWTSQELILVHEEFAAFISEVSKGEKVFLLIHSMKEKENILKLLRNSDVLLHNVDFVEYSFNDSWIRDFGPDFFVGENYKILNWRYNAWGEKYPPFDADNQFNNWLAGQKSIMTDTIDFVLEGGSVELNGAGDLITTESCLLNPNRNFGYSKAEIELLLKDKFKIQNVVWLKKGLEGDDTDGHVDDMFRFVSESQVVGVNITDTSHSDFDTIQENRMILSNARLSNGKAIELIDLPAAPILMYRGEQLPASYANFYISNHAVIVPQFEHKNDLLAVEVLRKCFPDREVIGLSSKSIIIGLGSFHCLSKQQPLLITD